MGLFSRNYNKPGPGIPKDMPRKKGAARFFELLLRDFSDLVKLSLLISLIALPSVVMFVLAAWFYIFGAPEMGVNLIFMLLSLVFAFPIGGGLVACYFNITRFMRDDPSYVWFDFKRKFKENYKQAAPMGMVCTLFVYWEILLWLQMYYAMVTEQYTGGLWMIILVVLSLLMFFMITPYIFMHYAYVNLRTWPILKNSLLMSFAYLPRSFMGAVLGSAIWVLIALTVPASLLALPFVPLILVSLSMLMQLSWVWPPFDKFHNIEETLIKMKEASFEEEA